MKRIVALIISMLLVISLSVSCVPIIPPAECTHVDLNGDGVCEICNTEYDSDDTDDDDGDGEPSPDTDTDLPGSDDSDRDDGVTTHLYNAFTPSEKDLFKEYFGEVIPFVANDEYYVEEYVDEELGEKGINYYAWDITEAEFKAYLALFSSYYNDGTDVDDYGDTWYLFSRDTYYVDLSYYETTDGFVMDLYAYVSLEDTPTDDGNGGVGGSDDGDGGSDTDHLYTGFTSAERAMLEVYGFVIPFIPNDYYVVETFADSGIDGDGVCFYTYDNTEDEFFAYLDLFYDFYTYDYSEEDDYGDTWYYFSRGDVYIDICYYDTYDGWCVDVYVYTDEENPGDTDTDDSNITHITNDGKGLPEHKDGSYKVDFTNATNVKDVTDQGYYLDGCPTVGSPSVLVVPVEFKDVTAASKGYTIDKLNAAFNGESGSTDYYSVWQYYYISSYGKLDVDFTVLDEWYTAEHSSSYYASERDYDGTLLGDQILIDEILAALEPTMNLSEFDSDRNGVIDAIVIINTLEIDYDSDINWAYRYWNTYTDSDGYYYEYDGVSANDYLWASYQFLYEAPDGDFDDTSAINTYTYIHEFGHILGADDYYDVSGVGTVLDGHDVMDSMAGDHSPYSKFNYGWITTSRLVVTDSSVTLTLEDFSKNGDTILLANNWDDTLGAYQEYYIVMYYTESELNSGAGGYFDEEGIVVYHINSSLYREVYEDEIYYDVYNNNTDPSDEYGTEDNLIELVTHSHGEYVYGVGDRLPTTTLDGGDTLIYTFTVDSLDGETATITFTKAA